VTLLRKHSFISVVAVLLVAIVTGFSVGRIYVGTLAPEVINPYSVEQLSEKEEVVQELVNQSVGKTPDKFNAVQVYNIAEYNLNNSRNFFKLMNGTVHNSMTGAQAMRSEKIRVGDEYCFNKLSPNLSLSLANVCSQVRYDAADGEIKIAESGTWLSTTGELKASFDSHADWTKEKYLQTFNIGPTVVLPYIISSNVCFEENVSAVKSNGDGTYSFDIDLSGDYLTLAASYYTYEIMFSSGLTDAPVWKTLHMTVTVDEKFNFVSIDYKEVYDMSYLGITVTVTDTFFDTFEFEDVPEISEIRGSEVA